MTLLFTAPSWLRQDEARIQKVTKRLHTLEEVNNNVKLLHEMLLHYSQEYSSEADRELMKELFDRCENKRRTLFKLASETEDNDNSLGECERMSQNFSRVRVVTAHTVRDLFYCRGHPAGQ